MGWTEASCFSQQRQWPGEQSWHRRARRVRQQARAVLAVRRAREVLETHHGGGATPGVPMGRNHRHAFRPWVACTQCKQQSWVYCDMGIADCKKCGTTFPDPWPALARKGADGGEGSKQRKIVGALDVLLDNVDEPDLKQKLTEIKKTHTPAKKDSAQFSEASQKVLVAVKAREAAISKRDKAVATMDKLLEQMRVVRDNLPTLTENVRKCERELAEARAENERMLGKVTDSGPHSTDALVAQLRQQVAAMQAKLAELGVDFGGAVPAPTPSVEPTPGATGGPRVEDPAAFDTPLPDGGEDDEEMGKNGPTNVPHAEVGGDQVKRDGHEAEGQKDPKKLKTDAESELKNAEEAVRLAEAMADHVREQAGVQSGG